MSGCNDPDCPACQLRAGIQPLADAGLTAGEALVFMLAIFNEVYPGVEVASVPAGVDLYDKPGSVH